MSLPFGTVVPNPPAPAASDDVELTEAISDLTAREARFVGINGSFTPVLDIPEHRTRGSDKSRRGRG